MAKGMTVNVVHKKPRRSYGRKSGYRKGRGRSMQALRRLQEDAAKGVRGSDASINFYGRDWALATDLQRKNRQMYGFTGRGDYDMPEFGGNWLKYGGALASRGLGYAAGTLAGQRLGIGDGESGWNLGGKFSRWMGWGDYTGNQLMGGSMQAPSVNQISNSGDLIFSHKELLANVIVTGTAGTLSSFNLQKFELNPGLPATFPFGSQIARNFVLYDLVGCIFTYKPLSGDNAANTQALGKVIMATQYDPSAPDFIDSTQMQNYDYACSCKPNEGLMHGVETANVQNFGGSMKYIRTGEISRDKLFTDLGNLYVATEGVPLPSAATELTIGELWISYGFRLSRAQIQDSYSVVDGADYITHNGALPTLIQTFGTRKSTNNIGCTLLGRSASSFDLIFPGSCEQNNTYIVIANFSDGGAASRWLASTNPTRLNFNLLGEYLSAPGVYQRACSANQADSKLLYFGVTITSVTGFPLNSSVTLNLATSPAAGNFIHLWVYQVPRLPTLSLT